VELCLQTLWEGTVKSPIYTHVPSILAHIVVAVKTFMKITINKQEQVDFCVGLGTCDKHGRVRLVSKAERNEYGYFVPVTEGVCEVCQIK